MVVQNKRAVNRLSAQMNPPDADYLYRFMRRRAAHAPAAKPQRLIAAHGSGTGVYVNKMPPAPDCESENWLLPGIGEKLLALIVQLLGEKFVDPPKLAISHCRP